MRCTSPQVPGTGTSLHRLDDRPDGCFVRTGAQLAAVAALFVGNFGAFAQCTPAAVGATGLCPAGASLGAFSGPRAGAYLGDQRLSNFVFAHSLQDRWGDSSPDNPRTVWFRGGGLGMGSTSAGGGLDTNSNAWMMQGGGDVAKFSLFGGTDRLHLGAMAGYAGTRTDAHVLGTPFSARGDTSGSGVGMYGTWYQNDRTRLGWYADVWGQYSKFSNQVQPGVPSGAGYDSQVGMLSAETGYAMRMGETSNWVIEPQGQIIYFRNRSSSPYAAVDPAGTSVEGAHGAFASRLGVRLRSVWTQDSGWRVRPYAAFNWWYDNAGAEIVVNPYSVRDLYPGNRYELKAGVSVDISPGWAGWGDLGWQWGNQSYQAWTVRGGMKYAW